MLMAVSILLMLSIEDESTFASPELQESTSQAVPQQLGNFERKQQTRQAKARTARFTRLSPESKCLARPTADNRARALKWQ